MHETGPEKGIEAALRQDVERLVMMVYKSGDGMLVDKLKVEVNRLRDELEFTIMSEDLDPDEMRHVQEYHILIGGTPGEPLPPPDPEAARIVHSRLREFVDDFMAENNLRVH